PDHGRCRSLNERQKITLDPELINAVRNLEGESNFIRLHQFNRCKPPLEHIRAETQPDTPRYFPPNAMVSLLHLGASIPSIHNAMSGKMPLSPFRPCLAQDEQCRPFPSKLRQNDFKSLPLSCLQNQFGREGS